VFNINSENNMIFTLSANSTPILWKPLTKDGFDLPPAQQHVQPASVRVFQNETYDFESSADVLRARITVPNAPPGVDDVSLQLRVRP